MKWSLSLAQEGLGRDEKEGSLSSSTGGGRLYCPSGLRAAVVEVGVDTQDIQSIPSVLSFQAILSRGSSRRHLNGGPTVHRKPSPQKPSFPHTYRSSMSNCLVLTMSVGGGCWGAQSSADFVWF